MNRRPSHLCVRIYKIFALHIKGEFFSGLFKLMFQIEVVTSCVFHVKQNLGKLLQSSSHFFFY